VKFNDALYEFHDVAEKVSDPVPYVLYRFTYVPKISGGRIERIPVNVLKNATTPMINTHKPITAFVGISEPSLYFTTHPDGHE
jgi:hypothetical protein